VLVVSDFLDTDFEKPLRMVSKRHDTVAIHLQDVREKELPSLGLVDLTDPETGETITRDFRSARTRQAFAEHAAEQQSRLTDLFRRVRVDSIEINTGESYVESLISFFRRRTKAA
jgi:uncharacterized protein (DUF58 family)